MTVELVLLQQFMAQEVAEFGDIPFGGGIGGQHLQGFSNRYVANSIVQQHYRLGAIQAGGVQYVVRFQRHGWIVSIVQ